MHRRPPHAGQRDPWGQPGQEPAHHDPSTRRPPDLVGRAFTAPAPNHLWVADITDIRSFSGWVHAAFVLDVYSHLFADDLDDVAASARAD